MSEAKGGKVVTMEEAWKSGQKEAKKLLKKYKQTKHNKLTKNQKTEKL